MRAPRRLLGLLAIGALAVAPGVAAAAPPSTVAPGVLTVGLNMPSDGFQVGAVAGNRVVAARGLEIDLAHALAQRVGRGPAVLTQEPRFTNLLAPGPKPWDIALAQVTITDARAVDVDFSVPYLQVDQGVLLSTQTTARPRSIADLTALRLCAQKGSTGADLVTGTIRPTQPGLFATSVTVLARGLRSGRCEAVVYDAPSLATLRAQVPTRYGRFAGVIRTGERYGVVLPEGSALRAPVNRAITILRKDGTIAALQRKYLATNLATLPVLQ